MLAEGQAAFPSLESLNAWNLHLINLDFAIPNDLNELTSAQLICLSIHPKGIIDDSLVHRARSLFLSRRFRALQNPMDRFAQSPFGSPLPMQINPALFGSALPFRNERPPAMISPPPATTPLPSAAPPFDLHDIAHFVSHHPIAREWDLRPLCDQLDYLHLLDTDWQIPMFPLPPIFMRRLLCFEPNRGNLPMLGGIPTARPKQRAGRRAGSSSNAEVSQEEAEFAGAEFVYGHPLTFAEFAWIRQDSPALYAYVQALASVRRLYILLEGGSSSSGHPSLWVQFLSRARRTLGTHGPGPDGMNSQRVALAEIMQDANVRAQIISGVPTSGFMRVARPVYECRTATEWHESWQSS